MEETREQQQMYSMFRSCIYLILIIEIVMNLPITSDNRMVAFVLELNGALSRPRRSIHDRYVLHLL